MIRKLPQKITSYILLTTLLVVCFGAPSRVFASVIDGTVYDLPLTGIAGALLGTQSGAKVEQSIETGNSTWQKIRDDVLDPIAYNIAQQLSTKMTSSVINWANGGFNGAPNFIQDFGNYFKQQGETVLNSSLNSLQSMSQNNPFARDLALQLINNAQSGTTGSLQQGLKFNLDQVVGPNYQQFYTNAGVGGWSAWNAIANPANNPVGSSLYLNQYAQNKTAQLNNNTQLEALGGGGFLNIKKCSKWQPTPRNTFASYTTQIHTEQVFVGEDTNGDPIYEEQTITELVPVDQQTQELQEQLSGTTEDTWRSDSSNCQNWETQTPGSLIKSSLDKALGVSQDRLTQADKYKELLSASLTSLITGLTNAGLKALTGSFSQQPLGSIGTAGSTAASWLNLPNQIVNIDEVQQIRKPDGTLAINPDRPNPIPTVNTQQTPVLAPGDLLRP